MKNILITVLTFLILILTVILMIRGIKIGNFQILSISQIAEGNENLTAKIDEVNILNNVTYKKNLSELNDNIKKLDSVKSNYLDIASVSSDDEIKAANQTESYTMEYLWSQIGNHATAKGVNLKMEVSSTGVDEKNNLNFTATGSYIGIRNFVYSLENDSDLNFKIEKFKLVSGSDTEKLTGTFTVSNISIKAEKVSTSVNSKADTSNKTNEVNTTNTVNTDISVNNNDSETADN